VDELPLGLEHDTTSRRSGTDPSAEPGKPRGSGPTITIRPDWIFDYESARDELCRQFGVQSLEGFGLEPGDEHLVRASGALIHYATEIQPSGVTHLRPPRVLRPGSTMRLDEMTRRNLELVETLRPGSDEGTLLGVIDRTLTSMGARLLRSWVLSPLVEMEIRDGFKQIADLERLAGKVGAVRAGPRELLAVARSLSLISPIRERLGGATAERVGVLVAQLDPMTDVRDRIERVVDPEAPASLQAGGVIRSGHSAELDQVRATRDGAVDFIARLQASERERTGITSLKIGFNKVFGYYLEVTKANIDKVPAEYIRKQTLANAERYFTPELKEWEETVADADERIRVLEAELFQELRQSLASEVRRLQATAAAAAELDALAALAELAIRSGYVRPEVHGGYDQEIVAGRHPVVETMMPREDFIPNDVKLGDTGRIMILTGPNMSGKSTLLRQVGLIQMLAQIGSFVPAERARLPVVDRIFTRVGASDNLVRGQSTFMVEMTETSAILHGATDRSLVLLDEVGRGTSTYDGVSIAWAVTEHLHEEVGAKTIFATHYHELTQLGDLLPGARNMNVSVREVGEDVVFLRRLEEGGADRSYGIQVARLAGLPSEVLVRAREILTELEGSHSGGGRGLGQDGAHRPPSAGSPDQLMLALTEHPVLHVLRGLDVNVMTPLEALNRLADLKRAVE
jgi:DNA mismatch repair protein MutS